MRPSCKCHGEPMIVPSRWQCAIQRRAQAKRYRERSPEKERERVDRWYAADPMRRMNANFLRTQRQRRQRLEEYARLSA